MITNSPPKIIHCVERHKVTNQAEVIRRQKVMASWEHLYSTGRVIPAHYWAYERDATEIGDKRQLPYLKDVLKAGMAMARSRDIIMWTNDDNILHAELPDVLERQIAIYEATTAHRCEFKNQPLPALNSSPCVFAATKDDHMGRDLFAFSKGWLTKFWDEIPDFILGASDFDLCIASMIRHKKGFLSTRQNYYEVIPCAELPKGYVIHEWHAPRWNDPDNINTAPSQLHNRRLFSQWAKDRMIKLAFNWENTI